jgi:hypothetical protein
MHLNEGFCSFVMACIALNPLLTVLHRRRWCSKRWMTSLSGEEMQARYLTQVIISSCAVLLIAAPLQVCTVEPPFDDLFSHI